MYYVAHRLFAAHDRALGAFIAQRLAAKAGPESVFLPFCDTDEEDLIAPVKGRRLFELDRARLESLTGMIAVLHGPSLDDGVCMEIGYATALDIPVVVVTTDFQTYSAADNSTRWEFPDPLIEVVARRIVRVDRLGTPGPGASRDRFAAFAARNQAQLETAAALSVEAVLELATANAPGASVTSPTDKGHAFIEPSPYTAQPETWPAALQAAGFSVTTASRHRAPDPVTAARGDWRAALHSEVLVADVSGPETPPGAALLVGATTALRRRIAAYLPTTTLTHARGREPNWRNLMIQYAAGSRIRDVHDVASWLAL
ncbi:nucleoside 2-deoxyribosyltransferase [Streptomyces sp. NPDC046805]|uniref:nucleoside 2-deoxyribosyltransferase n=1 Tax=Streptomyces sp. NPDC046805 TaxID=3155134 RepID=UPI0033DA2AD4